MNSYIQCGNQVHRDNDPRSPLCANLSQRFLESDAQHWVLVKARKTERSANKTHQIWNGGGITGIESSLALSPYQTSMSGCCLHGLVRFWLWIPDLMWPYLPGHHPSPGKDHGSQPLSHQHQERKLQTLCGKWSGWCKSLGREVKQRGEEVQ